LKRLHPMSAYSEKQTSAAHVGMSVKFQKETFAKEKAPAKLDSEFIVQARTMLSVKWVWVVMVRLLWFRSVVANGSPRATG
jgi:hypothetical protein